jgi:hypothetical protein
MLKELGEIFQKRLVLAEKKGPGPDEDLVTSTNNGPLALCPPTNTTKPPSAPDPNSGTDILFRSDDPHLTQASQLEINYSLALRVKFD